MAEVFNWVCPHCDRAQTVADGRHFNLHTHIRLGGLAEGDVGLTQVGVACANQECRKLTLAVLVGQDTYNERRGTWELGDAEPLLNEILIPRGASKPQPDYIPLALREDYYEACLIRDLSPKSSATLARRCIQGMIRDFTKISARTLNDEINQLRAAVNDGSAPRGVTIESVEAIDHVRSIGNIGAHMERDIDLIVPVEPGEAQQLIGLIEMLFTEWYVELHNREQRLANLKQLAEDKKLARKLPPPPNP